MTIRRHHDVVFAELEKLCHFNFLPIFENEGVTIENSCAERFLTNLRRWNWIFFVCRHNFKISQNLSSLVKMVA